MGREASLMERRFWTVAENERLRRSYPHRSTIALARSLRRTISAVYGRANILGLRKTAAYLSGPHACRLRRGDDVGRAYCFLKGHVPWNKNMKGWKAGGRSAETRFKPGNVSKRWDPEVYCVGALRINTDGGLDIKLRAGPRAWDSMARWTWKTERGAIPRGRVVRPINGDAHDTRIENLRLGTRAELMLQNTLHRYPKPIVHSYQLLGALHRQINRRTRDHDHHQNAR